MTVIFTYGGIAFELSKSDLGLRFNSSGFASVLLALALGVIGDLIYPSLCICSICICRSCTVIYLATVTAIILFLKFIHLDPGSVNLS